MANQIVKKPALPPNQMIRERVNPNISKPNVNAGAKNKT
jgi:hypothetical protein